MLKIILINALFFSLLSAFSQKNNLEQDTKSIFRIASYKNDKVCALSFTFDDGVLEHYTLAVPQLEKHHFRGTFWINGKTILTGEKEGVVNGLPRIDWEQLKEMADKGHEISNHGWSHKKLTECNESEIRLEIKRNDSIIEEKTGYRPITFCYPGNRYNSEIVKIALENRVGTRTKQYQIGRRSTKENLQKFTQDLIDSKNWVATMIHGINSGYDIFTSDTILWNYFAYVKSLENKIWVAPFRDVAAYTKEQENTIVEIVKKRNKWILTPKCVLDEKLFTMPLTMVMSNSGCGRIIIKQGKNILPIEYLSDQCLFDFNPHGSPIIIKVMGS